MHTRRTIRAALLPLASSGLLLFIVGCGSTSTTMVSTPNLYSQGLGSAPYTNTPEAFQSSKARMLYATDRQRTENTDGTWDYTHLRSNEAAYGITEVNFTHQKEDTELEWEELVELSVSKKRDTPVYLELDSVEQIGEVPSPRTNKYERINGVWEISEAYKKIYDAESKKFNHLVSDYAKQTTCKEAFVYVHGVNTSFEQSTLTTAQLWHMLGRTGIPITYTWPSGRGGLLRGYNYDRESSEFTVLHFKTFLQVLANNPDIEKINILAHSRGTDVTVSALRELHIFYEGRGESTNKELKLGQVILAAPDLDIQVLNQRFNRGGAYTGPDQITIYFSPTDKAIKASIWLFDSVYRLGKIMVDKVSPDQAKRLKDLETITAVEVRSTTTGIGHGYFVDDPATLSDVILVLQDGLAPGSSNGRPLTPVIDGIWRLKNGYPNASDAQ